MQEIEFLTQSQLFNHYCDMTKQTEGEITMTWEKLRDNILEVIRQDGITPFSVTTMYILLREWYQNGSITDGPELDTYAANVNAPKSKDAKMPRKSTAEKLHEIADSTGASLDQKLHALSLLIELHKS